MQSKLPINGELTAGEASPILDPFTGKAMCKINKPLAAY